MAKTNRYNIVFYLLIILIAALPLTISGYFYNINDLPKSSVLMLLGGALIIVFTVPAAVKSFKQNSFSFKHAGSIDYGILLFVLSLSISAVFSLRPVTSFFGQYERQFGLVTYFFIAAVFFIAGSVNSNKGRKSLLLVMEIVSVIISVYSIFQILHADPFSLQPPGIVRPVGTLGNAVFLGGFLILSFPFSMLNVSEKKNRFIKIGFPVIILSGIVVSGTRSAYIAILIQLLLVYFVYIKRNGFNVSQYRKQIITGIILSVLIAAAIMILYNDAFLIKRVFSTFSFNNPRLILWQDSLNLFLKYPLSGCGIAMFPAAFEDVYSNMLRYADASTAHDHAHSNYIHILCTAGVIGLAAYIFMLFGIFRAASLSFRGAKPGMFEKKLPLAVIIMVSGYAFYGLTNFDDIAVTFYLFIYIAIFRSVIAKEIKMNISTPAKIIILPAAGLIFAGCALAGYRTVNNLQADRFFLLANIEYGIGEFPKALDLNNKAILLNPDCGAYRYTEASQVYNFCFENSGIKPGTKQKLLSQVETEIGKMKDDLYYINYCNGLLSLVYFEQGRIDEAENLKEQVLAKDSMNINYRLKLARYLLKENRLDEAYRSIKLVLLIKPKELASKILAAVYYRKVNDRDNAVKYSRLILIDDPYNITAINILKDFGEK